MAQRTAKISLCCIPFSFRLQIFWHEVTKPIWLTFASLSYKLHVPYVYTLQCPTDKIDNKSNRQIIEHFLVIVDGIYYLYMFKHTCLVPKWLNDCRMSEIIEITEKVLISAQIALKSPVQSRFQVL